MDELNIRQIFGLLVSLVILGVAIIALTLERKPLFTSIHQAVIAYQSRLAALSDAKLPAAERVELRIYSDYTNGVSQSNVLELSNSGSQSSVLELPKASPDFNGVWGAYTHSTVFSVVPGALVAKGPDRISVTFGRQGDSVFVASELYTPPNQQILGKPRAWMSDPTEALIKYKASDPELYYVYTNRFKLLGSGKIAYSQTVDIYERRSHSWVGAATQHALLKQLTTREQRQQFARPSPFEVSRGETVAGKSFPFAGSPSAPNSH